MPRFASLVIRTLAKLDGKPNAAVPEVALRDYFRAFDLDISFTQGTILEEDPTETRDSVRSLLDKHAPPIGQSGAAILVVADVGYLGPHVNGMLLDAERRGACAVFTGASGFSHGDPERRFEIYTHELGHLLNLTHGDADGTFASAMDSYDERVAVLDRSQVWNDAINKGPVLFAQRLRGFFNAGVQQPLGLPMSERCCNKLVTSPRLDVEPWLSPFVENDPQDREDGSLQCRLELHGDVWAVAHPLDFTVTLSLPRGAGPSVVPAVLERTSGELVIELMQPNGKLRVLRPRQLSCASGQRRLRPGQKIRRHDSLISDCNDLVFPMPGRYEVRALIPQVGSRSRWTTIDVAPAFGALAEPNMQSFLRRGMPTEDDANWQHLTDVMADKMIAPHLRADLWSRSAARGRRAFEPLRQLSNVATPAVVEQDALRRVAYLRRHQTDVETMHRAIDRAERVFASSDAQHPTLGYLAHLRRELFATPKKRKAVR